MAAERPHGQSYCIHSSCMHLWSTCSDSRTGQVDQYNLSHLVPCGRLCCSHHAVCCKRTLTNINCESRPHINALIGLQCARLARLLIVLVASPAVDSAVDACICRRACSCNLVHASQVQLAFTPKLHSHTNLKQGAASLFQAPKATACSAATSNVRLAAILKVVGHISSVSVTLHGHRCRRVEGVLASV